MENFQFTEKEMMIMKDVRKQNFFTRAMPLSLGCIVGCHVLMRRGIVGTSRPFIRYFVFGSIGYTCGLISMPGQMKERLLSEAPDGAYASFMKQTEQMSVEERKEFLQKKDALGPSGSTGSPNTASPSQYIPQKSAGQQLSQDIFPQQTPTTVLDNRKTTAPETGKSTTAAEPGFSYRQQRMNPSGNQSRGMPVEELRPISQNTNRNVQRNKYGDEME